MLTFCVTDPNVDRNRLMKICLVHDLAEALVGDITPPEVSGVSKEDKKKMEEEAMRKIAKDVGGDVGDELLELWLDYEEGWSIEAAVAKQLDKFEMIMQADE